jgi:hypothetical protein
MDQNAGGKTMFQRGERTSDELLRHRGEDRELSVGCGSMEIMDDLGKRSFRAEKGRKPE